MTDKMQPVGRIAFRHEGQMWNAYYAMPETMDRAVFLGGIVITGCDDPAVKRGFIDLMRKVVGNIIAAKVGTQPSWIEPVSAPEHEKAGHT